MKEWEKDKHWTDRFLLSVKRELGPVLLCEAPEQEDQVHATDLVVLKMRDMRIAVRMRRYEDLARYGHEFTLRKGRPNGAKTELTKVIEGWGDYLFYGFSSKTEDYIERWSILDLSVFRLWFNRQLCNLPAGCLPGKTLTNKDGTTFQAFRIAEVVVEGQAFVVSDFCGAVTSATVGAPSLVPNHNPGTSARR